MAAPGPVRADPVFTFLPSLPDLPGLSGASLETWAGADVASSVWLVYAGATVAPFGAIHDNGLRLRAAAGSGEYSYADDLTSADRSTGRMFHARTAFAEALVGYLWRLDPLTAKAFVGLSHISHDISPLDDESVASGEEFGVKGVIELWLNTGPSSWSSLDLAWSTAFDTRSLRMRSGYRLYPWLSLGVEGGLNIDAQAECKMQLGTRDDCRIRDGAHAESTSFLDYGRTGLFARYEWTGGEASVSAGVLGAPFEADGSLSLEPYVTVNLIKQF